MLPSLPFERFLLHCLPPLFTSSHLYYISPLYISLGSPIPVVPFPFLTCPPISTFSLSFTFFFPFPPQQKLTLGRTYAVKKTFPFVSSFTLFHTLLLKKNFHRTKFILFLSLLLRHKNLLTLSLLGTSFLGRSLFETVTV